MVWGFYPPSGIGKYTPGAESEVGDDGKSKYELRLNTYFHSLPDEEKEKIRRKMGGEDSYSRFVSRLLWSCPSHRYSQEGANHNPTRQIEDWQVPSSLTITQPYNRYFKLGDFFGGLVAYVSKDLRDVILALEPNVHRFFPIEVTNPFDKDGEDRQFYLLIIGQYLDGFRPDLSNPDSFDQYKGYELYKSPPTKRYFGGLAISAEGIRGAHLWSELRFTGNMICMSDELKTAIDAAGLDIPRHHRMQEV
ncbi:MAG: DUF1629 domain-containing protein [Pseudomonadota bacterium]